MSGEVNRVALTADLQRINELQLWDYEIESFDHGTLLILGSNDFVYYHYLEAEFSGVTFCDLPRTFSHAEFHLVKVDGETATIRIFAESMETLRTEFEIRAASLQVRIGKAYYYERENLQPGERIVGKARQD